MSVPLQLNSSNQGIFANSGGKAFNGLLFNLDNRVSKGRRVKGEGRRVKGEG